MANTSYLRQIVNRSRPFDDGVSSRLPVLSPSRPLFRQWEVNQSLDVGDDTALGEESPATLDIQPHVSTPSLPIRQRSQDVPLSNLPAAPIHQADSIVARKAISETAPSTRLGAETPPSAASPSPHRPEQILPNPQVIDRHPSAPAVVRQDTSEITQPISLSETKESTPIVQSQPLRTEVAPALSMFRKSSGASESLPGEQSTSKANFPTPTSEVSPRPVARQEAMSVEVREPLSHEPVKVERSPTPQATPETSISRLRTTLEPTPLPQTRTIPDSPTLVPVPMRQTEKNEGSAIHIGSIDIQIMPPPSLPAQVVKAAPKPVNNSILARGFASSFGLRQG